MGGALGWNNQSPSPATPNSSKEPVRDRSIHPPSGRLCLTPGGLFSPSDRHVSWSWSGGHWAKELVDHQRLQHPTDLYLSTDHVARDLHNALGVLCVQRLQSVNCQVAFRTHFSVLVIDEHCKHPNPPNSVSPLQIMSCDNVPIAYSSPVSLVQVLRGRDNYQVTSTGYCEQSISFQV